PASDGSRFRLATNIKGRRAGWHCLPRHKPLEESLFVPGVGGRCHKPPDRPAQIGSPPAALKNPKKNLRSTLHRFQKNMR
ncbi:hypothetical protein, partial [Pusillimonas noertemannii]|uniref:hypothetical protein n=1 Tax=Pusillimonas noertemannii TaxID=305977 RepID=UPI001AD8F1BB